MSFFDFKLQSNKAQILSIRWYWPLTLLLLSACDSASESGPPSSIKSSLTDTLGVAAIDTNGPKSESAKANPPTSSVSTNTDTLTQPISYRPHSPMIDDTSTGQLGARLIGDYLGSQPCRIIKAQCKALKVELNLNADGTALKTQSPTDSTHDLTVVTWSGTYQQSDNVITIEFDNTVTEHYLIHDNQLLLLPKGLADADLQAFASTKYALSRQ